MCHYVNVELALDLMAAPLFWHAIAAQGDTSDPYIRMMTGALLRAINATPLLGRGAGTDRGVRLQGNDADEFQALIGMLE